MSQSKNDIKPPRLATRLFNYYCKNELADSILGDLQEQFYREAGKGHYLKARRRYWANVFTFINRHTLRRTHKQPNHNHTAMFKNYTLITLRNLRKKPVFSFINIFGLAIGLASCMIIYFYIQRELSFDRFHSNSENIYRVANTYDRSGNKFNWVRTPPALAPGIRDNFPGIGKVTRLRFTDEHVYALGDKVFSIENGFFADSLYLEMFDFKLKSGNPETALDAPNSIVLTEGLAERFFGNDNPLGKLIRFDNEKSLKVTGVFERLPTNSHIDFELLISFSTYVVPEGYLADLNSWAWGGFQTYIEISPNIDPTDLQQNITELYQNNYTRTDTKVAAVLQPLHNLYLEYPDYSNVGHSIKVGDKSTIYMLTGIATLVLLVAGLNFMNLSTAISLNRGKEIGMRKVMGAVRGKIKNQFLIESVIIALISMSIALVLVVLAEPVFNDLLKIELPKSLMDYLVVIPIFGLASIAIGILGGLYPSLMLSSFSPIKALKGNLKTGNSGTVVRKGLTIFQFVVSVGLMMASLLVVRQTDFMKSQSLGFDQENIVVLKVVGTDIGDDYASLKNTLIQNPYVSMVSTTSHTFSGSSSSGPARLQGAPASESHHLNYYQTGYDFLKVMDLELKEGRFFSKEYPNDPEEGLILNETAVKEMGLEEPLGQHITFHNRDRVVIGVIKDFNYVSLHSPISAMGIVMPFTIQDLILVKASGGVVSDVISSLEDDWNSVLEGVPFDAKFLDEGIQAMYEQETRLSKLVGIFSTLAVVLACLGLYGLVAFSVQARLKEVGIRKVLGGSVNSMLILLSRQFFTLILVANLIAVPLVYFLGDNWLSNFSYRTEMGLFLFLLPMTVLILIALITLSHQVIKAALTNPVKVLRND